VGDLRALVGSFGPKLKHFALGEDDRPLALGDEVKSISGEETFLHDTEDRGVLRTCLREQAAEIAAKLKRRHLTERRRNLQKFLDEQAEREVAKFTAVNGQPVRPFRFSPLWPALGLMIPTN
jgi:nucleotidyltransferase/DNA polymerase involved in DNA repair